MQTLDSVWLSLHLSHMSSPSPESTLTLLTTVHALTTWNERRLKQGHMDTDLSDNGRYMSDLLAQREELQDLDAIYTSDLKRSIQTAAPLVERTGLDPKQIVNLREINWPSPHREAGVEFLESDIDPEDNDVLQARAISCMQSLCEDSMAQGERKILIITHGAFLRAWLRYVDPVAFKGYEGVRTAINRITFDGDAFKVISLNDVEHLGEFDPETVRLDKG